MLEVHVIYIYVQYILIDLVKLSKDSANNSNKDSELKNYVIKIWVLVFQVWNHVQFPCQSNKDLSWGLFLESPWKPIKLFLVYLYLKMVKCICPKRLQSIKGTSVHFKNMWIKQNLCNHTVRNFDMALQVRKNFFGTFEK